MDINGELEETIFTILEAGQQLTLTWNCGGDDAIITIFLNQKELNLHQTFGSALYLYLANFLDLPDAGEFSMRGEGAIIIKDDELLDNHPKPL